MKVAGLLLAVVLITCKAANTLAQGVNHIQIIPSEPTTNDTIYVISDFSYYGVCEYGLVYSYTYSTDTSIYIAPTYCGYFLPDSTLCQRIDTFKVEPLPAGTYNLRIDYHQGSICPISDFDATIAEFDTSIVISGTNSVSPSEGFRSYLRVYPNPAHDNTTIEIENFNPQAKYQLVIVNTLGHVVLRDEIDDAQTNLNTSTWSGLYFLHIRDDKGMTIVLQRLMIL